MHHRLNIKCKTIKVLKNNIEENIHNHEYDVFLCIIAKTWLIKEKKLLDTIKFKSISSAIDNVKRKRWQATEYQKITEKHTFE